MGLFKLCSGLDIVLPLEKTRRSYVDMIDMEATPISEPPLTRKILDHEITNNIKTRAKFEEARHSPFPTRGVELLIRLVSDASARVFEFGPDVRDGFVRAIVESRKVLPIYNTKAEYAASRKETSAHE